MRATTNHRLIWPRAGAVLIAIAAISATLRPSVVSAESGAARDFKTLYLVADRSAFVAVCELLELDGDQLEMARESHDQYLEAVIELDTATTQRVNDAGFTRFAELSNEADRLDEEAPTEELALLRRSFHRERIKGLKAADQLLENFYQQLRSVLREDQLERFEGVPRLVRRYNYRRRRAGSVRSDFDFSVDLFALVESASQEGGELAMLVEGANGPQEDEALLRAKTAFAAVLQEYAITRDGHFVSYLQDSRRLPDRDAALSSSRTDPKGRRILRYWNEYYDTTEKAVLRIGELIQEVAGDNARDDWIERFHEALCPKLFAERWPDRMMEWVAPRVDVTDEQLEIALILYDQYLTERRRIRGLAVITGVRARRQYFSAEGPEHLQMAHARRKLQLRRLIDQAVGRLRAILTPDQRIALEAELLQARRYRTELLGPGMGVNVLAELLNEPVPENIFLPNDPPTGDRGSRTTAEDDGDQES